VDLGLKAGLENKGAAACKNALNLADEALDKVRDHELQKHI
jgi:GTP cyclohydrolase III